MRITINGRGVSLHRRLYCLTCSPFGKHNTKKLHARPDSGGNHASICTLCGRQYIYEKRSGHAKHNCNSCVANRRKHERKRLAVEYLGGRCMLCGYDRCIRALVFHHLDPSNKRFGVSGNHVRSWESLKTELDKCQLLCSNCHAEIHESEGRKVLSRVL